MVGLIQLHDTQRHFYFWLHKCTQNAMVVMMSYEENLYFRRYYYIKR